jgi:hypothetical protein
LIFNTVAAAVLGTWIVQSTSYLETFHQEI